MLVVIHTNHLDRESASQREYDGWWRMMYFDGYWHILTDDGAEEVSHMTGRLVQVPIDDWLQIFQHAYKLGSYQYCICSGSVLAVDIVCGVLGFAGGS